MEVEAFKSPLKNETIKETTEKLNQKSTTATGNYGLLLDVCNDIQDKINSSDKENTHREDTARAYDAFQKAREFQQFQQQL